MRPSFAHIYVENRCNLKCEHCYESNETHPANHHLGIDDYRTLFSQLAEMGVFVLTFSGGEPFLRRDFLDIVALARSMRFAVRIYTSGTLLTAAKADRLKALQVQEVHISLYSHDAKIHDSFTGIPRSHEKSVAALKMLNERGIRTVLKSSIMTFNVDFIDELLGLARSVGADYRLDPTVKPKMNGDKSPLRFAVPPEELKRKILWRQDLANDITMEEAEGICDGENHRSGGSGGMCAAATKLITINADGTVAPCTMFPVNGGNFRDSSVAQIWNESPLFQGVRQQRFDDMKSCGDCEVQSSCDPCMAYAIVEHQDQRACNVSSKRFAEARALHSRALVTTQRKSQRGRALPIFGDATIAGTEMGKRLSTEH